MTDTDGLAASVTDEGSAAVIVLSGEAILDSAERLKAMLDSQLPNAERHLTVDVSGLSFADSASIRELLLAARTLRGRGGDLILLRPLPSVARLLELVGADQLLTIRPAGTPAP